MYKGKGVDLLKKEPLHVKENIKGRGLSDIPQDVGIPTKPKSKHTPSPSSLLSILGPYIPSSPMQDQQRRSSLSTFHPSKRPPYYFYPSIHILFPLLAIWIPSITSINPKIHIQSRINMSHLINMSKQSNI